MGLFDRARHEVAPDGPPEEADGLTVLANLAREQEARDSFVFDQEQPDEAQPESVDVSAKENDERASWLPPNFSDPESFVKSYEEIRAKFAQTSQYNAQLESGFDTAASMLEAQADLRPRPFHEQLTPAERRAVLTQRIEQIQEAFRPLPPAGSQQWSDEVAYGISQLVPDWDENTAAKVEAELEQNPNALPPTAHGSPQGMALALANLGGVIRQREWSEQVQREQQRNKIQAQTLSGQSGRPAPTDSWEDRWTDIMNAGQGTFGEIVRGG